MLYENLVIIVSRSYLRELLNVDQFQKNMDSVCGLLRLSLKLKSRDGLFI